ncbi:MAG: TonB-dependent receptor, partial [Proteobacteria bacterium]|nr:TonB-dependent receptor [Pseudomonadota bacterium]
MIEETCDASREPAAPKSGTNDSGCPHLQQTGLPPRQLAASIAMAIAVLSLQCPQALAENPAEVLETPTVVVIGTTPLPGLGTKLRDVPANVQVFTGKDLGQQRQTNLGDYLEQNPTSVTINSAQGNPFQSDVNFRGFSASPVLGTPQGLSVFQDGVRINEPFGDVVNWDLIPQSAISSIQLIPGSNPAFGLNTLGGALALYTKSGSHYPGGAIETYAGSFGRKGLEFEYGAKTDQLDYFLTGNYVDDHGWAEHNPSTVKQFFGKVGWQDEKTDLDLSLTLVDNTLQATQTLPLSFFDNIRQAYTFPDQNNNKLNLITLKGSHFLSDDVVIGGNLYYRKYKNANFSSNLNGNFDPVDDPVQATNDRAMIDQDSYGLGLQLTLIGQLAQRKNQLSVGASGDFGKARFSQESQTAAFTAERGTVGTSDFTLDTDARTRNSYFGLFFADTLNLNAEWALTVSGRYNRARVKIEDLSGADPLLNADHTFSHFNPALGINFSPSERLTAYAAFNEGMRAPTPIELACADPAAPCKLPNNFLYDPALKKVVSKTLETGMRGKLPHDTQWSAAIYRTELTDDIQFISSNGASLNTGYFQNVGQTRRIGLELALSTKQYGFTAAARYSYVNATFESPFELNSPSNSTADANGAIRVRAGDRIPGIPQHSLKLRLQYDFGEQAALGTNIIYSSSVFARGDENNQDVHGRVPGYTVVNLDGRYSVLKNLELFARVANLFDKRYANMGVVGENFFTGPGRTYDAANTVNEQFRGPGVPRGAWIG